MEEEFLGQQKYGEKTPLMSVKIEYDFESKTQKEGVVPFPLLKFPNVVLFNVLKSLSAQDLVSMSKTNKKLNNFVNTSNPLWQCLIERDFGSEIPIVLDKENSVNGVKENNEGNKLEKEWEKYHLKFDESGYKDSLPEEISKWRKTKGTGFKIADIDDPKFCEKRTEYIKREFTSQKKFLLSRKDFNMRNKLWAFDLAQRILLLISPTLLFLWLLFFVLKIGESFGVASFSVVWVPLYPLMATFFLQITLFALSHLFKVRYRYYFGQYFF